MTALQRSDSLQLHLRDSPCSQVPLRGPTKQASATRFLWVDMTALITAHSAYFRLTHSRSYHDFGWQFGLLFPAMVAFGAGIQILEPFSYGPLKRGSASSAGIIADVFVSIKEVSRSCSARSARCDQLNFCQGLCQRSHCKG